MKAGINIPRCRGNTERLADIRLKRHFVHQQIKMKRQVNSDQIHSPPQPCKHFTTFIEAGLKFVRNMGRVKTFN